MSYEIAFHIQGGTIKVNVVLNHTIILIQYHN